MPISSQELDFHQKMVWSFCVQWFEVRGDCSCCWYWWNCCPSQFKLSFHKLMWTAWSGNTLCICFLQTHVFSHCHRSVLIREVVYLYRHTTVAIVVDLSKPKEIWHNLETLLNSAKSRINTVIEEVKSEDPGLRDRLTKQAWQRVGEEHTVSILLAILRKSKFGTCNAYILRIFWKSWWRAYSESLRNMQWVQFWEA